MYTKVFQIPNYEFVDYLRKKTHSIFVRYHLAIFTIRVNTNVSFLNSQVQKSVRLKHRDLYFLIDFVLFEHIR